MVYHLEYWNERVKREVGTNSWRHSECSPVFPYQVLQMDSSVVCQMGHIERECVSLCLAVGWFSLKLRLRWFAGWSAESQR